MTLSHYRKKSSYSFTVKHVLRLKRCTYIHRWSMIRVWEAEPRGSEEVPWFFDIIPWYCCVDNVTILQTRNGKQVCPSGHTIKVKGGVLVTTTCLSWFIPLPSKPDYCILSSEDLLCRFAQETSAKCSVEELFWESSKSKAQNPLICSWAWVSMTCPTLLLREGEICWHTKLYCNS